MLIAIKNTPFPKSIYELIYILYMYLTEVQILRGSKELDDLTFKCKNL